MEAVGRQQRHNSLLVVFLFFFLTHNFVLAMILLTFSHSLFQALACRGEKKFSRSVSIETCEKKY